MVTEWWQPVTATLLYTAQSRQLDDELVDRRARALLEEPVVDFTPEEEYRAISAALASGVRLTEAIPESHGEQEFRDFLKRIQARMDAKRPWLVPLNRPLGEAGWIGHGDTRVIGRIGMNYVNAQSRIKNAFRNMQLGDAKIQAIALQLRSGDEIALAAPWWPDSDDVAVLTRDRGRSAGEVVAALVDGSGFVPDEVVEVLDGDGPSIGSHHESL